MSDTFSDIKVFKAKPEDRYVATGSVTVAGLVTLGFKVIKGQKGNFVSFPAEKSTKLKDDGTPQWFSQVRFLNRELSDELNELVLAKMNETPSEAKSKVSKAMGSSQTKDTDGGFLPF